MNTAQRVLKFLALAVAAVLIIAIFSGIAGVGMILGRIFSPDRSTDTVLSEVDLREDIDMNGIRRLELKASTVRVKVVSTDEGRIRVESNSDRVKVGKSGEILTIEESDFNLFENIAWGDDELVVYLPKSMHEFDFVSIETGAGKMDIERLETKELRISMGAGKVEIQEVIARNRADIDGGAGMLTIRNGELRNLDFDMGVGKVEIEAALLGSSEIDAGLGRLDLRLLGDADSYRIKVERGLGSVKLDGNEVESDRSYGEGENLIEIDGGVGAIEVRR